MTSHIELMISHLERQSRLWGEQYIEQFTTDLQARLAELEEIDYTKSDQLEASRLFANTLNTHNKVSKTLSYKSSPLAALTHTQAQSINALTHQTFRDFGVVSKLKSRDCWQTIEKTLIHNTSATKDEINDFYEVSHGLSSYSLRDLELLRFRHRTVPLFIAAYESIQGMKDQPSFIKLKELIMSVHQPKNAIERITIQEPLDN